VFQIAVLFRRISTIATAQTTANARGTRPRRITPRKIKPALAPRALKVQHQQRRGPRTGPLKECPQATRLGNKQLSSRTASYNSRDRQTTRRVCTLRPPVTVPFALCPCHQYGGDRLPGKRPQPLDWQTQQSNPPSTVTTFTATKRSSSHRAKGAEGVQVRDTENETK